MTKQENNTLVVGIVFVLCGILRGTTPLMLKIGGDDNHANVVFLVAARSAPTVVLFAATILFLYYTDLEYRGNVLIYLTRPKSYLYLAIMGFNTVVPFICFAWALKHISSGVRRGAHLGHSARASAHRRAPCTPRARCAGRGCPHGALPHGRAAARPVPLPAQGKPHSADVAQDRGHVRLSGRRGLHLHQADAAPDQRRVRQQPGAGHLRLLHRRMRHGVHGVCVWGVGVEVGSGGHLPTCPRPRPPVPIPARPQ